MKLPHNKSVAETVIENIEQRAATAKTPISTVLARAGVNDTTWWRWKNGKSSPTLSTIQRLGRVLDEIEGATKAA
jgi:transcriptional regulator with XRE-family HTH domain